MARTRRIHLINPKADTFATRPLFFGKALYSPVAGLLAVAALIPEDEYEIILTDENIEPIDFDLSVDMVGISAMTSYVNRGYEIADAFRVRGIPVIMGGVHVSYLPQEALKHADAVLVGEAELIMDKVLDDLKHGQLNGVYKAENLHSMINMPKPRQKLLKSNRYINKGFVQTSRGCHHGCTFCAEPTMYGLRFRYRPIEDIIAEIEHIEERVILLNDSDFFGTPSRAMEVMKAFKGRGLKWQAAVNSRDANDERLLELAAESGCFMLSIGFESISKQTLRNVHKCQNNPESYRELVEKLHRYGIMVLGLFMFGFEGDEPSVFEETLKFNIEAKFDMCGYSLLTPYPGTINWFEMMRRKQIVSFDWDKYDQSHIVFKPAGLSADQLYRGYLDTYDSFYTLPSMLQRFPWDGSRNPANWTIYNAFFRKGGVVTRDPEQLIAKITPEPEFAAMPPLMPQKAAWRELVMGTAGNAGDVASE
ncbi:B12-binding domain-containing radical SAM protein [Candidatus Methylobacter oryzae]|uniref:B12-binding domain-containing radical SAM protein n=1 Tax=Candidatus Methylobacter oryzae TaxID=2497749 RepID=A0ABY3CFN1_9GAMM|nr:radical SAM protein [Candidatus Methylobacter oryzae]TRX02565.1 B12-binding domain-containing radical SAM protein [Candidatus Methylobacter oryzae]